MRKPKVMIVEDDDLVRELLTLLLQNYFEVHSFSTPEKAISAFQGDEEYDLLITDFDLKAEAMDGFSIASEFRENFPSTPMLMLSGSLSTLPRIRAFLEMPCTQFFEKPFDTHQLLEIATALTISKSSTTHRF